MLACRTTAAAPRILQLNNFETADYCTAEDGLKIRTTAERRVQLIDLHPVQLRTMESWPQSRVVAGAILLRISALPVVPVYS